MRTVTAARDSDYRCVFHDEDGKGITGIRLDKDLPVIAGNALRSNLAAFSPLVLPASEKLLSVLSTVVPPFKLYRPDIRKAFERFCIHAGARGAG